MPNFLEILHHRPPKCIWNKPKLFENPSLGLNSSKYAIIFSQSLIITDFLFYFWNRRWYSEEYTRRLHYIAYLGSVSFFKIFIVSKNQGFQCGISLKIPPSLPMEQFDLDIQKKKKFKISKDLSFQNNENKLIKYIFQRWNYGNFRSNRHQGFLNFK